MKILHYKIKVGGIVFGFRKQFPLQIAVSPFLFKFENV
jgi:hypothetical protein